MSEAGETVLAHGVGGSTDLPIPLNYALVGGVWALILTFAVVAVAWRTPKFDPAKPGRALPGWVTTAVDSRPVRSILAAAALLVTVWVGIAAIWGPQNADNALPGSFYVLLWVGLVAVSVLLGPVWRVISPVRTLWGLLGGKRTGHPPRGYPQRWGYWPAAAGLFAFVWLELASPDPGSLGAIKLWILAYAIAMFAGAAVFGSRWFARADPFEVYSMTVSRLAPLRRNTATGRIVVGNPLDHLPTLPVRPGTVAVMAVLLGSTAFDSFSGFTGFRNFVDRNAAGVPLVGECRRRLRNQDRWPAGLRRRCGRDVFGRGPRDRRRHPRAAPRVARPAGALPHSDRRGLHLRPLPVLPGRARPGDGGPSGRPLGPQAGSCSGSIPATWSMCCR